MATLRPAAPAPQNAADDSDGGSLRRLLPRAAWDCLAAYVASPEFALVLPMVSKTFCRVLDGAPAWVDLPAAVLAETPDDAVWFSVMPSVGIPAAPVDLSTLSDWNTPEAPLPMVGGPKPIAVGRLVLSAARIDRLVCALAQEDDDHDACLQAVVDACLRRWVGHVAEADACASHTADAPPGFLRFYANGLFAATRRRIRAHPRTLYAAMLDRLEGRAPLRCVHPAASRGGLGRSREVPGWSREGLHGGYVEWSNSSRLVPAESDCLMLEKLWHVLLGEPAVMPLPAEYNAQLRNYGGGARVGHIVCKPGTPG